MKLRLPAPSVREATIHSVLLAIVLWSSAAVILFVPSGMRDLFGGLKGADFVFFYALGTVARTQQPAVLYDHLALHELQVALVPASASERYPSAYPPQTAVFFAPLTALPYAGAAILWAALTALAYALVTMRVARGVPLPRSLLAAALVAFPPFWYLIVHGQTTIFPFLAFGLGGLAWLAGHRFWAGVAFGFVASKPQLGLPLAVALLATAEWRVLAGAVTAAALQTALAAAVLGPAVWLDYLEVLRALPALREALEPQPHMLHSLTSFTRLLPPALETAAFAAAAAFVLWHVGRVWRGAARRELKLAVMVLAAVLLSPHLNIYDATLLVLPVLWTAGAVDDRRRRAMVLPVYALVFAFLAPTEKMAGVQLSVLVIAWMLYRTVTWAADSVEVNAAHASSGRPTGDGRVSPEIQPFSDPKSHSSRNKSLTAARRRGGDGGTRPDV